MAIPHAAPGQVIDIKPLGESIAEHTTRALFKTRVLEVIHMVLPAKKAIPEHKVAGEITVQCLEGRIMFTALGKSQELRSGQMLYLNGNEPHSLESIEESTVLLTILLE